MTTITERLLFMAAGAGLLAVGMGSGIQNQNGELEKLQKENVFLRTGFDEIDARIVAVEKAVDSEADKCYKRRFDALLEENNYLRRELEETAQDEEGLKRELAK